MKATHTDNLVSEHPRNFSSWIKCKMSRLFAETARVWKHTSVFAITTSRPILTFLSTIQLLQLTNILVINAYRHLFTRLGNVANPTLVCKKTTQS
jgi:hypothetical protein